MSIMFWKKGYIKKVVAFGELYKFLTKYARILKVVLKDIFHLAVKRIDVVSINIFF